MRCLTHVMNTSIDVKTDVKQLNKYSQRFSTEREEIPKKPVLQSTFHFGSSFLKGNPHFIYNTVVYMVGDHHKINLESGSEDDQNTLDI